MAAPSASPACQSAPSVLSKASVTPPTKPTPPSTPTPTRANPKFFTPQSSFSFHLEDAPLFPFFGKGRVSRSHLQLQIKTAPFSGAAPHAGSLLSCYNFRFPHRVSFSELPRVIRPEKRRHNFSIKLHSRSALNHISRHARRQCRPPFSRRDRRIKLLRNRHDPRLKRLISELHKLFFRN